MPSIATNRRRKKALKAFCVLHHIPLAKGFAWQGPRVGKPARETIRRAEHFIWPDRAPTGTFNTDLLAHLFPPAPWGQRALLVAERELGVREDPAGSNTGARVKQYQAAATPGTTGYPWCAAYVTWTLRQVGWKVKFANMAYVPAWVAAAHSGRYPFFVIPASEVEAGDIACYDWQHDRVADHIGWARGPVRNGKIATIEGNTSQGNQSNGGQVQHRERNVSDVLCFIRLK